MEMSCLDPFLWIGDTNADSTRWADAFSKNVQIVDRVALLAVEFHFGLRGSDKPMPRGDHTPPACPVSGSRGRAPHLKRLVNNSSE
ncbi:unnamed protein product [Leptosia nina]|uniref:Uncharacterized protein n=1 Tax=Leptosia nina TaxID=320188 RepID=A0AAV1J8D2_9NEOP